MILCHLFYLLSFVKYVYKSCLDLNLAARSVSLTCMFGISALEKQNDYKDARLFDYLECALNLKNKR
jgi:hypothetical protein